MMNCSQNKEIVIKHDFCQFYEPLPVDLEKDVVKEWEILYRNIQIKLQLNQPLTANDKLIKAFLDNISRNDKKFEERNCYAE